ncbi:hypothetical protein KP509_1Z216800 [Ceratopteris richardii]|nr:hypothetical protein KP509_1Z216800 [Ceratopteris richardii]
MWVVIYVCADVGGYICLCEGVCVCGSVYCVGQQGNCEGRGAELVRGRGAEWGGIGQRGGGGGGELGGVAEGKLVGVKVGLNGGGGGGEEREN